MINREFFPERLVWWFFLQLGLGFSPLIFAAFADGAVGWNEALGRGDMILISVVLAGGDVAAAEHVHATSNWRRVWRALIIACGVVYCVAGAWFYGHGVGGGRQGSSYSFLALAVVIGISDSYLQHVEEVRSTS